MLAPICLRHSFYAVFGSAAILLLRAPLREVKGRPDVSLREMFAAMTPARIGLLVGFFLIADTISAVNFLHITLRLRRAAAVHDSHWRISTRSSIASGAVYLLRQQGGDSLWRVRVLAMCTAIWVIILVIVRSEGGCRGNDIGHCTHRFGHWLDPSPHALALQRSFRGKPRLQSYSDGMSGHRICGNCGLLYFSVSRRLTMDSKRLAMGMLILPLCVGFFMIARFSRLVAKST